MPHENLLGQKFNKLTVVSFSHIDEKRRVAVWNCLCDCGNDHKVQSTRLKTNNVRSCGCLRKEALSKIVAWNYKDLTGEKFSRLTVIGRGDKSKSYGMVRWLCRCECGEERQVLTGNLTSGKQVSCGCLSREKAEKNHITHGMSHLRIYRIWSGAISRCYNPNVVHYNHYGGRGISVSESWRNDFMVFYNDMAPTYQDHLELDRIDVNGNYCKENCRWATSKENGRNKRTNVNLTIDGETKCISAWAEEKGLNPSKIYERSRRDNISDKQKLFGRTKLNKEKMIINKSQWPTK